MALPMLVGGAECGPSNALQGLTKAFDQDRGINQDLFGAGRAGPSRQTFRSQTQQTGVNSLQQEANQFFSSEITQGFGPVANLTPATSHAPSPAPGAFDLSALRGSLPASQSFAPSPVQGVTSGTSWALDFLSNQSTQSPVVVQQQAVQHVDGRQSTPVFNSARPGVVSPQWMPFMQRDSQWSQQYTPPASVVRPEQPAVNWDKEFQTQEALLSSSSTMQSSVNEVTAQSETIAKTCIPGEEDELVRTAGLLLDTVKNETNPKFKESTFMALLRKIKDREVTVQGNDIVETANQEGVTTTSRDKGKQRAVDFASSSLPLADPTSSYMPQRQRRRSVHFQEEAQSSEGATVQEDANDAYFRQDNEDYINYWNTHDSALNNGVETSYTPRLSAPMDDWGALQADWDAFEATTTGVKPVETYQFQPRNPYLHRDQGVTRTHAMHSNGAQSFYESVLELEAAVQRDHNNAFAWCELGIKQQENEREHKAILALQRAVDLEPDHLPAWLALAISHTNDNNRVAAYDAIEQWLNRNPRYQNIIGNFRSAHGHDTERKHSELIECLMIAARSGGEDVDADVQIALAVLLNTSEEYAKARDCFSTALAVRPDDWQLYNRVGATLANSGNAEEALQYYYRALELNPAYIRARFNLGISCINMRRFEEAAHHILDALVLQDSDGAVDAIDDKRGITSSALWESLKTSCLHLQRIDLATLCDRQDLEALRREFSV